MINSQIFVGTDSTPYSSLVINDKLHAANTLTFNTHEYFEEMQIVHAVGDHQTFGGEIVKRKETPEGFEYECMDFTRRLHGKILQSHYNKTISQIAIELLTSRGLNTGGITKTTKKHPKLIFKNKKAIDVCHQLANLESNIEFFVNSDNVAVLRQIPQSEEGYVFFSENGVMDYDLSYDSGDLITGVDVFGENDKLLYSFRDSALVAKYGHLTDIIEDSSLKTKSEAKGKADELFREKGKIEFSGTIVTPVLPLMRSGIHCIFVPPSWSKQGAKTYYVQDVTTTINDNTSEQKIDFLNGKPTPPSEWVYEKESTTSSTSSSSTSTISTAGLSTVAAKGVTLGSPAAIREWIDANIKYEFYYNHRYSASQVLSRRKANCMDQARLFVEMVRPLNKTAKVVCGKKCNGYRHCNAEIKINGRWIVADTTCHKLNRL